MACFLDVVQRIRCLVKVGPVFPLLRRLFVILPVRNTQTENKAWEIALRNALDLPMNQNRVIAGTLIHQLQMGAVQFPTPNKIP